MKYLIGTTEVYRVDTEEEENDLRELAYSSPYYEVADFRARPKVRKSKGEIVDEWREVTIKTAITDETEPDRRLRVKYEVDA